VFDHYTNQVLWIARDGSNRVAAVRDADSGGRSCGYAYDGAGNLVRARDVRGYETAYGYDAKNRLVTIAEPGAAAEQIGYNEYGFVTAVTVGGRSKAFSYSYDAARREYYASVQDAGGRIEEHWFDADGAITRTAVDGEPVYDRAASAAAAAGSAAGGTNAAAYAYDARGNVTNIVYPDGTTVARAYDPASGRLVWARDELGRETAYAYDAPGNLTIRTEGVGTDHARVTRYEYDNMGYCIRKTVSMGERERTTLQGYEVLPA